MTVEADSPPLRAAVGDTARQLLDGLDRTPADEPFGSIAAMRALAR